jgi:hypothetical protein
MITQVSYARLYNTGNYENVRFEATASVGENGPALAFDEVVAVVHEGYAQWLADREAEAAERKAELERRKASTAPRKDDAEDLF